MQVSNIKELDTHAVIGGGKAEAFGMSESAEFFTVLSDTLYRDKVRAVAREVICNAWDAHIITDQTDLPIEIKLTNEELVIKDFGPGIAPERMRPIYCIYGASTKVKSEKETGGFGLGSKAPFAYSDHFSVTSAFEGLRTVYAVSRGGAETDGKPDMRPMVQTPTKATGITVSIPIRNATDRQNFENHIKAVVRQGGIKAKLNDVLLDTIDYEPSRKLGYMLMRRQGYGELNESVVYVLYGTVLYPLTTTHAEITKQTRHIANYLGENRVILLAPANSVGVTPSRESLSYSDKTIETCVRLLKAFTSSLKHDGEKAVRDHIKSRVKGIQRHQINLSMTEETVSAYGGSNIQDRKQIAQAIALAQPNLFTTRDQRQRVLLAGLQKKFRDSRRTFRRMGGKPLVHGYYGIHREQECEIYRHTRRLVLRMASKLNLLSDLMVYDHQATYQRDKLGAMDAYNGSRPVGQQILISPTQRDALKVLMNRYANNSQLRHSKDLTTVFVVKKMTAELRAKIEELSKHFKFDTEFLPFPERKKPKRGEKVEKGLFYAFSEVKHGANGRYRIAEKKTLPTAPKFYMNVRGGLERLDIDLRFFDRREDFGKFFGEIALANTVKAEAKLKMMGSRDIEVALIDELKAIASNREVAFAYLCRKGELISSGHYRSVSHMARDLIMEDIRFAQFFFPDAKIVTNEATEKAEFLMQVMQDRYNYGTKKYRDYQTVWEEVRRIAKGEFKDTCLDAKTADERFSFLKVLSDGNFSPDRSRAVYDFDETLALLKWLKARHERKAKTVSPNNDNTTDAQKEAA
ncbi:ATP-binding protein [Ensifer sp. ENS10]|uniref:ATP-binding protein n=1 Tax=Ensifer sp. ENS10 TaxID=2769286 RepID=UPI00177C50D9|nr:ATP-binding protein [Ensifer sp. ENS10]MBD9511544.1 ATP-binding protein [Ensifer sp. ENS10]